MSKVIKQYGLDCVGTQSIAMPEGARILSLQSQQEAPQLWALVETTAPIEHRTFVTYGTGYPMPDQPGEYVGTYQLQKHSLVFHVFEPLR